MSNIAYGPKARCITAKETITSLQSRKANIIYGLRLNPDFREYLQDGVVFGRKNRHYPNRDLTDICEKQVVEDSAGQKTQVLVKVKSREDRCNDVDLMLEQIANYCPNVPRNNIVKDCGSLAEVFQTIRQFYNKQQSGGLLNDVWNIHREADETPQALYARIKQQYDDNLLTTDGLTHVGGKADEDEEMSPTLLNTVILHWLQTLHPGLRDLVTNRFVTQLRDQTYAAILPEISKTVDSLLEDLNNGTPVNRVFSKPYNNYSSANNFPSNFLQLSFKPFYKPIYSTNNYRPNFTPKPSYNKHCEFCKMTGKRMFHTHNIEECLFIKRMNSRSASAKQVSNNDVDQHYERVL